MSAVAPRKKAAVPATAERKPKGRGHERREEILAAAARMFLERGVERVSTRAIADAVGISQTSLYVYFPNRNAILEELCDQCFLRLLARFSSPEVQSGTPVETLRKMMRAYVEFGIEHSDEYRIGFMMKEMHQRPEEHLVAGVSARRRAARKSRLSIIAAVRVRWLTIEPRVSTGPEPSSCLPDSFTSMPGASVACVTSTTTAASGSSANALVREPPKVISSSRAKE